MGAVRRTQAVAEHAFVHEEEILDDTIADDTSVELNDQLSRSWFS